MDLYAECLHFNSYALPYLSSSCLYDSRKASEDHAISVIQNDTFYKYSSLRYLYYPVDYESPINKFSQIIRTANLMKILLVYMQSAIDRGLSHVIDQGTAGSAVFNIYNILPWEQSHMAMLNKESV